MPFIVTSFLGSKKIFIESQFFATWAHVVVLAPKNLEVFPFTTGRWSCEGESGNGRDNGNKCGFHGELSFDKSNLWVVIIVFDSKVIDISR